MGLGRGREVVARSFHPAKAGVLTRPSMFSGSTSGTTGDLPLRPITSATAVDPLSVTDLSDWFDPFLKHFMRETLRSGGEVVIAEDGPRVRGVFLHDPVENVASIFTRSPALANAFYRLREKAAVYSEILSGPPGRTSTSSRSTWPTGTRRIGSRTQCGPCGRRTEGESSPS